MLGQDSLSTGMSRRPNACNPMRRFYASFCDHGLTEFGRDRTHTAKASRTINPRLPSPPEASRWPEHHTSTHPQRNASGQAETAARRQT